MPNRSINNLFNRIFIWFASFILLCFFIFTIVDLVIVYDTECTDDYIYRLTSVGSMLIIIMYIGNVVFLIDKKYKSFQYVNAILIAAYSVIYCIMIVLAFMVLVGTACKYTTVWWIYVTWCFSLSFLLVLNIMNYLLYFYSKSEDMAI